jgi:hypothetical protein
MPSFTRNLDPFIEVRIPYSAFGAYKKPPKSNMAL